MRTMMLLFLLAAPVYAADLTVALDQATSDNLAWKVEQVNLTRAAEDATSIAAHEAQAAARERCLAEPDATEETCGEPVVIPTARPAITVEGYVAELLGSSATQYRVERVRKRVAEEMARESEPGFFERLTGGN